MLCMYVCLCVFDQVYVKIMSQNEQYHTRQLHFTSLYYQFYTKPGLWKAVSAIPTMWGKYIRNYTSSCIENADGNSYFLLTFHFLLDNTVNGLEKQHARETLG